MPKKTYPELEKAFKLANLRIKELEKELEGSLTKQQESLDSLTKEEPVVIATLKPKTPFEILMDSAEEYMKNLKMIVAFQHSNSKSDLRFRKVIKNLAYDIKFKLKP